MVDATIKEIAQRRRGGRGNSEILRIFREGNRIIMPIEHLDKTVFKVINN